MTLASCSYNPITGTITAFSRSDSAVILTGLAVSHDTETRDVLNGDEEPAEVLHLGAYQLQAVSFQN